MADLTIQHSMLGVLSSAASAARTYGYHKEQEKNRAASKEEKEILHQERKTVADQARKNYGMQLHKNFIKNPKAFEGQLRKFYEEEGWSKGKTTRFINQLIADNSNKTPSDKAATKAVESEEELQNKHMQEIKNRSALESAIRDKTPEQIPSPVQDFFADEDDDKYVPEAGEKPENMSTEEYSKWAQENPMKADEFTKSRT